MGDAWPEEVTERRKRLGWTRYRLAREAGVVPDTIVRLEEGRHEAREATKERVERALAAGEQAR